VGTDLARRRTRAIRAAHPDMRKLDAHSRMEAIRVAEERGWL
jgi:hypothetical protein